MPTLILGIITLGLSPIPILNQGGILVGLVGACLGIAALVIGLRRRVRVVLSAIGLALCVVGLIVSFAVTQALVDSFNTIGSTAAAGPATPAQEVGGGGSSEAAAAAPVYTFSITGSASSVNVNYSVDGSTGSAESVGLPWTKDMTASSQSFHSAFVSAFSDMGDAGDLTCTITDQTGKVLSTQTAASQGGEFGSASVNCFS